jgi:hypothetical protein
MKYLKLPLSITAILFYTLSIAEGHIAGDSLTACLSKEPESPEVKNLMADYKCEMANEARYLSKEGMELIFQNKVLNQIILYRNSSVYGSFKNKLPKNLVFGMSSGEVKRLLGKTSLAYNTGYCEFDLPDCSLSCWFEGDKLNQVNFSAK